MKVPSDVANNAWYFTAVKYCYDTTNNGYRLMEGDSAATFAPNGSFTRAHMVQPGLCDAVSLL